MNFSRISRFLIFLFLFRQSSIHVSKSDSFKSFHYLLLITRSRVENHLDFDADFMGHSRDVRLRKFPRGTFELFHRARDL